MAEEKLASKRYSHVVYLEASAYVDFASVKTFFETVNETAPVQPDILWLGYTHPTHSKPNSFRDRHPNPSVMGSKCLVFRRKGLRRVHEMLARAKRYCHFDMHLRRAFGKQAFWLPPKSLFGSRKHFSVPAGGLKKSPRMRVRAQPGVRRKCT
jgi:hypothetical protein